VDLPLLDGPMMQMRVPSSASVIMCLVAPPACFPSQPGAWRTAPPQTLDEVLQLRDLVDQLAAAELPKGSGGTEAAVSAVRARGERIMWVLVVFAVNAQSAFSIPGYSSEQTCSAKGKEIVELARSERGGNWVYRCLRGRSVLHAIRANLFGDARGFFCDALWD
jgi:hypothetical protein